MELRIARHTDNLIRITEFYTNIIGLDILFSFENHNDYSAVFLGIPDHNWHLEFTTSKDKAQHKFDEEDLMVFYPANQNEYHQIVERIKASDLDVIKARNPFWNENGVMVQDPDGYGIIVSNFKLK